MDQARREFFGHLPPGYPEETMPADAAWDCVALLEQGGGAASSTASTGVGAGGAGAESAGVFDGGRLSLGRLTVAEPKPTAAGDLRLRRAGRERLDLSSLLHVLENFGLVVVEAVPWHFTLANGQSFFVDDIGLRGEAHGGRLIDAIDAVVGGLSELTPLDRLVAGAGMTWQEVNVFCAYCQYRRQAGGAQAVARAQAMVQALVASSATAQALLSLFKALLTADASPPAEVAKADVLKALASVTERRHDQALRELLVLVEATLRTTWPAGATVAFKLDSMQVPFLPSPRPFAEVYVWSPWFEGLHLRFGPVARGGIRWSDRSDDLRGEVLGLARAQLKKNSLIVPTGAKGAFTLRHPSVPGFAGAGQSPVLGPPEARRAYRAFINALLELTDNVVDGKVAHPAIICRDGYDPYLVVAADKGTASFSDLANDVSLEKRFWLGDAFASGGSHGYDHKALGITARGVWLAVRRHFRALGMDADEDGLRVAGVGDMSGDVFGNGMLQSRHISLVAAFDHRHIFIDPAPDPATSFQERSRLSRLPGSSWANYDLSAASPGAAVYSRQAKEIELSPPAAKALAMGRRQVSPPQLVQAVLRAPVDLLFFGGIGTFVRGPGDDDAGVEDHANDEVRLSADELRARVVAEGANLAMTPAARVAYSRRGGRVNADFVDNAAGVALSDREVNLKVLLALAISAGELGAEDRLGLLAEGEADAAASVLQQADEGIIALDRAAASSAGDFPAYAALLNDLESEGLFERDVEALPSEEELARRAEAGAGFSRPELAVLVAYARSELARAIEPSPLTAGGDLRQLVLGYFPGPFRSRLGHLVADHPLYRQLGASTLANELLACMGPVWAHESALETGRPLYESAAAYWAAREILAAGPITDVLASDAGQWPLEAEYLARDALAEALAGLARWCLLHPGPLRPAEVVAAVGPLVGDVAHLVTGDEDRERSLGAAGAPAPMARQLAQIVAISRVGQVASVCRASGRPAGAAVAALDAVAEAFSAGAIARLLSGPAPADRWDRRQTHLLADDLARSVVATAAAALGASDEDGAAAVAWYLSRRPRSVARLRALAAALAGPGPLNLSLLALAVRAMGQIAQEPPEQI